MLNLAAADLVKLFCDEFELCKLNHGEHVVVLTEPTSRGDYAAAAFAAAQLAGAHVVAAQVPGGSPVPTPSTHTGSGAGLVSVLADTAVQQLLKNADFVVDLTREGFIHAPVQSEILATGTRILFVCDPPDVLARNMGVPGDSLRVQYGVDRMSEATSMRVTSTAGTDFTMDLNDSHPGFQKGFADLPGTWDHWPSTMVLCWPVTSEGTIVLAPNDIVLPFKEYVRSPVEIKVVAGQIASVDGHGDADFLGRFILDSADKWARYVSHAGWGMMRNADWYSTAMYAKNDLMGMDARGYAGNFLWSTGPHPFLGREDSYAHLDIAMRDCTITLDGRVVVENGNLIESESATPAPPQQKLLP
jgi:2,5-dihydroxypyridine 5,6-dioxygenase